MMPSLEPSKALREALACLEEGDWDHRHHEGARQNALDSIAWSLAGILAHLERNAFDPVDGAAEQLATKRRRHRRGRDALPIDATR